MQTGDQTSVSKQMRHKWDFCAIRSNSWAVSLHQDAKLMCSTEINSASAPPPPPPPLLPPNCISWSHHGSLFSFCMCAYVTIVSYLTLLAFTIMLVIIVIIIIFISRVSDQNGVSLLYIMLKIHHFGWEPSISSSVWLHCISRGYQTQLPHPRWETDLLFHGDWLQADDRAKVGRAQWLSVRGTLTVHL